MELFLFFVGVMVREVVLGVLALSRGQKYHLYTIALARDGGSFFEILISIFWNCVFGFFFPLIIS